MTVLGRGTKVLAFRDGLICARNIRSKIRFARVTTSSPKKQNKHKILIQKPRMTVSAGGQRYWNSGTA